MSKITHFYFFVYIYYNVEKEFKENKEKEQFKITILGKNEKVKPKRNTKWLIEIFLISLCLSILFSLISELMLSHTSLALALFLILFLMFANVIFDVIGVAVTACNIKPILDLSRKNVKGADFALKMVKNADKISCICSDVVGDICSILCGAGGVTISVLLIKLLPGLNTLILTLTINAIIASIAVLGKAIGKTYALNYSLKIVLQVGKLLTFKKKDKNK